MSYFFDGANDKIAYTGAQWADTDAEGDWSASVWINHDQADVDTGYIIARWGSSIGWYLRVNGTDTIRFGKQLGNASNEVNGGTIPDDVWTNYIITYTASTNGIELFGDGTSLGTATGAAMGDAGVNFCIGNRDADDARDFKGYIAEVGAWNEVLTAGEIADLQTKTPDNVGNAPDFYVALASDGDVGTGAVTGAVFNASHPTLTGPSTDTLIPHELPKYLHPDFSGNKKPTSDVEVNWSHPILKDSVALNLIRHGEHFRDRIIGGLSKVGSLITTPNGARSTGNNYISYPSTPITGDFTLTLKVSSVNPAKSTGFVMANGGYNDYLDIDTTNSELNSRIASSDSNFTSVPWGDSHIITLRRSGALLDFFLDGQLFDTQAVTTSNLNWDRLCSGFPLSTFYFDGVVEFYHARSSAAEPIDILAWHRDFWQILEPAVPAFYFAAAEGVTPIPPALINLDNQFATITAHRLGGVLQ